MKIVGQVVRPVVVPQPQPAGGAGAAEAFADTLAEGLQGLEAGPGLDASGHANGGGPGHKTVYSYTDEAGTPVFEVERQRAVGGREKNSYNATRRRTARSCGSSPPAGRGLVYHLPAVKRAIKNQDLVVVVEGEQDADRLASLNLCTTCNAGGASAGRRSKWTQRHAAHLSGGGAGGGDSRRGRCRPGARGVGDAVVGRQSQARAGG